MEFALRSLLVAIAKLPWQATGEHPAIEYLAKLQALYLKGSRKLPVEVVAPSLGMIWQVSISSPDRERRFRRWRWPPCLPCAARCAMARSGLSTA